MKVASTQLAGLESQRDRDRDRDYFALPLIVKVKMQNILCVLSVFVRSYKS